MYGTDNYSMLIQFWKLRQKLVVFLGLNYLYIQLKLVHLLHKYEGKRMKWKQKEEE